MIRSFVAVGLFALASAAHADFQVTVKLSGEGTGKVNNGLQDCQATCSRSVLPGEGVTLSAKTDTSKWVGWSGGTGPAAVCNGKTGACTFLVTEPIQIEAQFEPGVQLTVNKLGTENGLVLSSSTSPTIPTPRQLKIRCPNTCQAEFSPGSVITLTPDGGGIQGLNFAGWSGTSGSTSTCLSSGPCTFTITQPSSVSFTFEQLRYSLNLSFGGSGSGSLTSKLGASTSTCNSPGPCEPVRRTPLTPVTVTASPGANSQFRQWNGGPCNGQTAPTCSFSLSADTSFSAVLDSIGPVPIKIGGRGNGSGIVAVQSQTQGVASSITGCQYLAGRTSGICSESLPQKTVIRLVATAKPTKTDPNPRFAGWVDATGAARACNGRIDPCQFTLSDTTSVNAKFCPSGPEELCR